MTAVCILRRTSNQELEKIILEAAYSGERFLVQREDGVSFAIVPTEDLELLQQIDKHHFSEYEASKLD